MSHCMGGTNFLKSGCGFFMCYGLERGEKKMLVSVYEGEKKETEREKTQATPVNEGERRRN